VSPPAEITAGLSITSSASHLTTSNATDYTPATVYTYTELDLYLAPGQGAATLDDTASLMLGFCQDPRGCYLGQGEGCTATGTGLNAMTESHGPVRTSNGIPTATGTAGAKNGADSRVMLESGFWVMRVLGLAFGIGIGLL
jgi:hypothetical protein